MTEELVFVLSSRHTPCAVTFSGKQDMPPCSLTNGTRSVPTTDVLSGGDCCAGDQPKKFNGGEWHPAALVQRVFPG